MAFSRYLRGQIHNDYIVGACTVQLHTGDPGLDGVANVAGDGLNGKNAVTMGASDADGFSANSTLLEHGPATSQVIVTHTSLWDGAGTNCLKTGQLSSPRVIQANGYCRFPIGQFISENL